MKDFIVWFVFEGEDDYMVISAESYSDALDQFFNRYCGLEVIECHAINEAIQEHVE